MCRSGAGSRRSARARWRLAPGRLGSCRAARRSRRRRLCGGRALRGRAWRVPGRSRRLPSPRWLARVSPAGRRSFSERMVVALAIVLAPICFPTPAAAHRSRSRRPSPAHPCRPAHAWSAPVFSVPDVDVVVVAAAGGNQLAVRAHSRGQHDIVVLGVGEELLGGVRVPHELGAIAATIAAGGQQVCRRVKT